MKFYKIIICICLVFISCKKKVKTNKSVFGELKALENIRLSSGKILRIDSFSSKQIAPRNVDIWLPENYSEQKEYAVLYMTDGQTLFDATNTHNEQEWMVDEIVPPLIENEQIKDLIVVGVWNNPSSRYQDYFPEKAFELLAQKHKDSLYLVAKQGNYQITFSSDEYLKFLVGELKPFIDQHFSTRPDVKNTYVAGANMGGLISMYAVCEYPEIFGGAACISTHWPGVLPSKHNPIPNSFFKYMRLNLPPSGSHKFYFDYGTEGLDEHYPQYLSEIDSIFYQKKYSEKNYMNLEFEGADHSEDSWNRRFDIPLIFLLKRKK